MKVKKKLLKLQVLSNKEIYKEHFIIEFDLPPSESYQILPGNFLNIYTNDSSHLMPRPFCIFDYKDNILKVFYQVKGCGTKNIAQAKAGDYYKVLLPLGNSFSLEIPRNSCFIAGGMGIAPIYFFLKYLSRHNKEQVKNLSFFYGSQTKNQLFFLEELKASGCNLKLSTDDGTLAFKGNCLSFLKEEISKGLAVSKVFACGPHKMLQYVSEYCQEKDIEASFSMEAKMGCGFGACVGCVQKVKSNDMPYKLVCTDGPVFNAKEIDWSEN